MQAACDLEYITATFIKELKNRFLCEVDINGERVVCYVPSSCHLSNFLDLEGKRVLLVPTKPKGSRTKYALFAVPYKRSYIVLNTSMANRAIENCIHSRRFSTLGKRTSVIKEHYVEEYKSDLYIKDTNTLIEIKSVLSTEGIAKFPTVFSERTLRQFEKIQDLLAKGYKIQYMIVSLNPYVKAIRIIQDTQFSKVLSSCVNNGIIVSAYSCRLKDNQAYVERRLPICFE